MKEKCRLSFPRDVYHKISIISYTAIFSVTKSVVLTHFKPRLKDDRGIASNLPCRSSSRYRTSNLGRTF